VVIIGWMRDRLNLSDKNKPAEAGQGLLDFR